MANEPLNDICIMEVFLKGRSREKISNAQNLLKLLKELDYRNLMP